MNYKKIYKLIQQKLLYKEPFLVLRIGDGEGIVISENKKNNYVFKRQFGHIPNHKDIKTITKYVKDAYVSADIIGIPTKFHIEECGGYWANTYNWLLEARPKTKTIPTGSIDLHLEFLKNGILDELLTDRNELVYISGRNLDKQLKNSFNIKHIDSFIVDAEQLFDTRKSQNHWPYQFNMIKDWIKETNIEGKLCLCGAGILGKWYSHLLKQNGGIVIDIGSVFDNWAGKLTRGVGRSATAIDNKYKLQ